MEGTTRTAPLRAARAALFAALCTTLSSTSHVLLSRQPLPLATVALVGAAVFAAAYALAGRERGLWAIAALLVPLELAADTLFVDDWPLCRVLLMKDANYPWFILLPDRADVSEIHQLSEADQMQLTRESACLARALAQAFRPDKLNIAALGNVVPQLHIHHIARYRHDPAWPAPVWGKVPAMEYPFDCLNAVAAKLRYALGTEGGFTPQD